MERGLGHMGIATIGRCAQRLLAQGLFTLVLAGLLGMTAPPAHALDPDKTPSQCRVDLWTQRDGLPARRIEALAQTHDGFLWMATRGGVVRFDGVNFKLFN